MWEFTRKILCTINRIKSISRKVDRERVDSEKEVTNAL